VTVARRAALLALLVYVTLDLSLPAMPGAFVFEPADSVESVHAGRVRVATVVVSPPCTDPSTSLSCDRDARLPTPARLAADRAPRTTPVALPRAALTESRSPASSADPH
jgi:hypothetical protein